MKWLGVAEALGRPWAHSLRGWCALLVPSTVVVLLQETNTAFPHFGLVLLSALLQHFLAGLSALPLIMAFRRTGALPVWGTLVNWTIGAVVRAITGAAMVVWFTDADEQLAFRVSSWLIVTWTWMPLLSYGVAQLEHRRQLLAALSAVLLRRDWARSRRDRTAEQIREELVANVRVSTAAVIAEIESALDASRHQLNADHLNLVSHRLTEVSWQVRATLERLSEEDAENSRPGEGPTAVPMVAALNFKRERPWRWSILSVIALAGVLMPIAYGVGQVPRLTELAVSLVVIAVTLGVTSRLAAWCSRDAVAWSIIRHGIAGFAGTCTLGVLGWAQMGNFAFVTLIVLPYAAAVAAETLSTAVGVAEANRELLQSIDEVSAERRMLESTSLENENRIREELHSVMHGPILRRLSSCAMALNFLATETGPVSRERTATVTSAVLAHLGHTMQDLRLLDS